MAAWTMIFISAGIMGFLFWHKHYYPQPEKIPCDMMSIWETRQRPRVLSLESSLKPLTPSRRPA
jgi:hypothetical protein